MQVPWSPEAAEDLERIVEYIRKENPSAGQRVAQTIFERAGALKTLPYRGRPGRIEGTRELTLAIVAIHIDLQSTRACKRGRNRQHRTWCATLAALARHCLKPYLTHDTSQPDPSAISAHQANAVQP